MYYYFFDLDDTLMDTHSLKFFNYLNPYFQHLHSPHHRKHSINVVTNTYSRNISKDTRLINLLKQINSPKYIITNASRIHCILSLRNLGIMNFFLGGIDANTILRHQLKPEIYPYLAAMEMSKVNLKKDKCIFFDNLEINLTSPKKLGWITVLIGKKYPPNKKPTYIDFCFLNIYDALKYFITSFNN